MLRSDDYANFIFIAGYVRQWRRVLTKSLVRLKAFSLFLIP